MDAPSILKLEAFLPYRLNVLAAAVSEDLARVYEERFGIDIPGWRVLATLGQFGAVTATQVGRHSRMHKTKVSRAVQDLTSRGLVRREQSPNDQRSALLVLTESGQRMYGEIIPLALTYERALLSSLTSADLAALDRLVTELTARADATRR